jgi:hypothetical protein
MGRVRWLLVLALLLVPASSRAIQLHWSSGADTLTFTEATRAILVLRADSAEVTLPPEWRLLWVGDSTEVQVVALDSLEVCAGDTAQVYGVDGPSCPEDSTAHRVTAHFCSGGNNASDQATYQLDLPAWGRGKCKVVALDPADSTSVLESNEVTFNGGVSDSFPSTVLLASRSHPSTELRVQAIGSGFAQALVVEIAAPDGSWRLPLTVVENSNTSITAVASVAADLPSCLLRVGTQSGALSTVSLDADTASVLSVQPACVDFMKEINLITHEQIQPKDFAFVASRDSFHLFYIRHDMNLSTDATEKTIGHKRSRNLNDWFPTDNTMTAISARTSTNLWDNYHVWAPTIIKKPNDITYYMLYTGVHNDGLGHQIQRIGVATSTDLNVWAQDTTWVYSPDHVSGGWAEQDSTSYSGQQFRDPFVMAAVDTPGTYLMFFVAGSRDRKPRMVVGVARSYGDLRVWRDVGPLWNTDLVHSGAAVVESPHAFADPGGRWALYYTGYNLGAPNDSAFVTLQADIATPSSPIDADTTHWSTPDTLYKALGGDQILQFWHGSEYLNWAPGYEYLAAYDDDQHAVDISEISWRTSHTYVLNDSCPPAVALGVDPKDGRLDFALRLLGPQPAPGPVGFAVETPTRTRVHLAIYDVLGRRVRTLLDEEVPPGRRELRWDGRGARGDAARSGVYFARLTSAAGQRVSRVVLLR